MILIVYFTGPLFTNPSFAVSSPCAIQWTLPNLFVKSLPEAERPTQIKEIKINALKNVSDIMPKFVGFIYLL